MKEARFLLLPILLAIPGTLIAAIALYMQYKAMNLFFISLSLICGSFIGLWLGAGIEGFRQTRKNIKS